MALLYFIAVLRHFDLNLCHALMNASMCGHNSGATTQQYATYSSSTAVFLCPLLDRYYALPEAMVRSLQ